MWLLALDNKLYWLLAGQKYTIGRASNSANSDLDLVVKGDASVSRKHATLEVRSASEDAAMHPSIRSDIIVTDLGSRFGTKVDGEQLPSGTARTLPQVPNGMASIKLGRTTKLRLKWQSFVVTYSTGQHGSAHETLWQHALDLLRPLDIKLMPYIVKSTDVFVKTGKYTTSLYYALTNQIPIVNNHYFEALQDAAAVCSTQGTADQSVIPDPRPFLPDPAWMPNPQRARCLSGTVLYLPASKYADALQPVLEAAGAQCTQAPDTPNAVALYPSESEVKKMGPEKFVLEKTVFQAIVDARPLDAGDIQLSPRVPPSIRSAPDSSPSRKRQHPDILDIMTSQETSPRKPGQPQPLDPKPFEPLEPGPLESKLPEPKLPESKPGSKLPESKSRGSSLKQRTRDTEARVPEGEVPHEQSQDLYSKRRRVRGASLETPQNEPRTSSQPPVETRSRKRKAKQSDDAPASKIAGSTDGLIEAQDAEGRAEESESYVSPVDYEAIGELAIVENSLDVAKVNAPATEKEHPEWEGRPNFKAFRRPNAQVHARKIEYDDDAPNKQFDYDDFGIAEKTEANMSADSTGLSGLAQLASNANWRNEPAETARSEEEEEQLFVNSDVEASDSAFESDASFSEKSTPANKRTKAPSTQPADDFGFSFS